MPDSTRRTSVHQALGGGAVADVLLWRRYCASLIVLCSSTLLWLLFEKGGYNFLSFVANVLLMFVTILFIWAKSAALLNRPLPPIPDMEISVEAAQEASAIQSVQVYVNHVISIAHAIAIGRNVTIFIQVIVVLWILSWMGSLFHFLTLIYIGVLLSLSLPVLYEKRQDEVDDKLSLVYKLTEAHCRNISKNISTIKEKKSL